MKKMKKPQCMIYSAAMVFDCDPQEIIDFLGHDGLVGVHMQELQSFAMSKGFALVCYEPQPRLLVEGKEVAVRSNPVISMQEDEPYLNYEGLMLGSNTNGNNHCVAWDGHIIFDPRNDSIFDMYQQFWAKIPLPSSSK